MQEPYEKGVANHLDPESCAGGGNIAGEALTGAHAGQPWSSEITPSGVPTSLTGREGHTRGGAKRQPSLDATESKNLGMRGNSLHGNRETPKASASPEACKADGETERPEKATGRTSGMYAFGESDGSIVPKKRANKAGCSAAEPAEGRGPTQGNDLQAVHVPDPEPDQRGSGLQGVRQAAKRDRKVRFTALLHHVTVERLRASYFELKRLAAPGVDGVTWQEYGHGLEDRLADLHSRVHRGAYRAQPSKRAWIPKADGRQRPLGIAALEDKIVQQAVATVLEQVYEEDFLGFTHCCGKTRKGWFTIKRVSIAKRMRAKLQAVKKQLRRAMHREVAEVGQWLRLVVQGWFNYHAVPGNRHCLDQFRTQVARYWRHVLRRRSQKPGRWTWERMTRLIDRWLPRPQTLRLFPSQRLIVSHPR